MVTSSKPVALVTGASSGMGKDFALRLIAEGYVVYGAARRVDRMGDIQARGGYVIPLDVTNDGSMVSCVDRIIQEQRRIDVLINNAGYGQFGTIEEVPMAEARRQMETNVFGAARLMQLVLPHMRERKFGKIFNISSIGGKFALPLGGWYHASKHALEALSDSLRSEVRAFGIDVVIIEPGAIETEWSGIAGDEAAKYSGQGVYANLVTAFRKIQSNIKGPPPKVITDLIVEALKAKVPATRYHGGGHATLLLFLRRWLPDRWFDKLMMAALG